MRPTQRLHDIGQSLWLDNITRDLLMSGTLEHYIEELSVTGLTSNPTIFDNAIQRSQNYDEAIRRRRSAGISHEALFFELAIVDLTIAADLLWPIHVATNGLDGWVSLDVSPLLANDASATVAQAKQLHAEAGRRNMFIKIPGTATGISAIEETIFAGIPVNVTLLFSSDHYQRAAEAYLRGIERRVAAGLHPVVFSVASMFISSWDRAVMREFPRDLRDTLGIAVARRAYQTYAELAASARWQQLKDLGAQPQRLLWATTSTKDPDASDLLYVSALAAPQTINAMAEQTLIDFADHGTIGSHLTPDDGDAMTTLARFTAGGLNVDALAETLQFEAQQALRASWQSLIAGLDARSQALSGPA